MRLVIEGRSASPTSPDPVLLKEIRRAHRCFEALVSGQVDSVAELATLEEISDRYVSSVLPLAFLAPDIVEAIAAGRQPSDLTAHRLIRAVDLRADQVMQQPNLGHHRPYPIASSKIPGSRRKEKHRVVAGERTRWLWFGTARWCPC